MLNHADCQTEGLVDRAHPFGVSFGQVVIDSNNVDTLTFQSIEVSRKSSYQGFSFAGFHLGDLALVKNNTADKLNIKVAHFDCSTSNLPDHGKGFDQNIIESCTLAEFFFKLGCFGLKLGIRQLADLGLEGINSSHIRLQFFQGALILSAENLD